MTREFTWGHQTVFVTGAGGFIGSHLTERLVEAGARVRPEQSEVERLLADNTVARRVLDWSPAVSLEEGLRRTIEWIREQRDVYRLRAYAI